MLVDGHVNAIRDFKSDAQGKLYRLLNSTRVLDTIDAHEQFLFIHNRNCILAFPNLMLQCSKLSLLCLTLNAAESKWIIWKVNPEPSNSVF
ncbi:hypothetical protein ACH58_10895 [Achromobacter xylosoxidans]|nr:hypothetical protein ACH58_10895 [Achromobacter xylosoxidans]